MRAEDFTKKVVEDSGIDSEKEELLGVDNMFKTVDLERRLEEKEGVIKEKEKEIKRLKKQLDETKKYLVKKSNLKQINAKIIE